MPNEDRQIPIGVRPLSEGLNLARNPFMVQPSEASDALNVDFDEDSVASAAGSIKMNNQTAPRPGVRVLGQTSRDAVLPVLPGKGVPVRGAVFFPYDESQDIGGDFAEDNYTGATAPFDNFYHRRRGSDFELRFKFKLPEDVQLFKAGELGQLTNITPGGAWDMKFGADQGLDEFTAILQKGGDRLTPMSWAVGVVNTGALFDTDVDGGGNNIFGVATSTYADRPSNYALCFMWLDSSGWGLKRPVNMRYHLTSASSIWSDETTHVAASNGAYCTEAYRSFIAPVFIEPGRSYSVAVQLAKDSGTGPTSWNSGTGELSGGTWSDDGVINVRIQKDYGAIQTFTYDQATPGSATLFRYKGPDDSLEYFSKYGIRYSGRDPMFGGLGYRFAAWSSAGFIPFGIDSCPVENGGFQITDQSVQGPTVSSVYAELLRPEEEESASNGKTISYNLKIAHDPAKDPTGTLFEISQPGFVNDTTISGVEWGNETAIWAQMGPQGRNPWAPYDTEWAGLGGIPASGTGFNAEALKSYRIVFSNEASGNGFANAGSAGGLISIGSYTDGNPYATPTYSQYVTAEGGDQFLGTPGAFGQTGNWYITIRAFRWNQRPVVISDIAIAKTVTAWSDQAAFTLAHEIVPTEGADPFTEDLRALWPLTDGGGAVVSEKIIGNHGYFIPMAVPITDGTLPDTKGVFLSGEGESLVLDMRENSEFRNQLLASLKDGQSGVAVQITVRIPEAYYGMTMRINDAFGQGSTNSEYLAKFAPPMLVWDFAEPDRNSIGGDAPATNEIDHFAGRYTRPKPLIEFGHNVQTKFPSGVKPSIYPLGFGMKVPIVQDDREAAAADPGYFLTAAEAMYAWNGLTSRWDTNASWAGKTVTFQVGFHPTGTDNEYKAYISAWPKEHLNKADNEATGLEFGYWSTMSLWPTDIERSIITIGGSWNPRVDEVYDTSLSSWQSRGRSVWEANTRMIVEQVAIFGCSAAGDLAATTGSAVTAGTGKIVGRNALPQRALEDSDLLKALAPNTSNVTVTKGSRTITLAGGEFPLASTPQSSNEAVARTFIIINGETEEIPSKNTTSTIETKTYYVESVSGRSITLNRPYTGPSAESVYAQMFRVIGYTHFDNVRSDSALALGKGVSYDLEVVRSDDALVSQTMFESLSPVGVDWRFRVHTSIPTGRAMDYYPMWDRGLARCWTNAIRGIHSKNKTLYAGAQGSVFEVDDRWRSDGPWDDYQVSLKFHGNTSNDLGITFPKQDDRVVFESQNEALLDLTGDWLNRVTNKLGVLDTWVYLDSYGGLQTIAWFGSSNTDPSNAAPTHKVQWWMRLSDGVPEFVVAADAVAGGVAPDGGLFVARGSSKIPLQQWTHIRWILQLDVTETYIDPPTHWVNGKQQTVSLSHTDDAAAAGSWIDKANVVAVDSSFVLALGAARAAVDRPKVLQAFAATGDASRAPMQPSSLQGWIHGLYGSLSRTVFSQQNLGKAGFQDGEGFSPYDIDYANFTTMFEVMNDDATQGGQLEDYGVGHKLLDAHTQLFDTDWGTIYSHPFISMSHEMGSEDAPFSFTNYRSRTFVANGQRVGVIEDGEFRFAGLLAPSHTPDIEVLTDPAFKHNEFDSNGDPDNGPIWPYEDATGNLDFTDPTVPDKVHHYNNPGSLYLTQAVDTSMRWVVDTYIAFKAYFRLRSVAGRINIWSRRDSVDAGHFLEVRDGYLYAGWYDTSLKKEVWVKTDKPVIEPGYLYYIYYRKLYPRGGLKAGHNALYTPTGSNWTNDIHQSSATPSTAAFDSLIWRRFPRETPTSYFDWTGWDAKGFDNLANYDYTLNGATPRACISATLADSTFTTNPYTLTNPYSGTGYVMFNETVSTGTGTSITTAGTNLKFCPDHVGMLLQISGGSFNANVYRIVGYTDATTVTCMTLAGGSPGFTGGGLTGAKFSVFMGVSLVKSPDYDNSINPDNGDYAIEAFGSSLDANPLNGMAPFDGEFWSPAWVRAAGTADAVGNLVIQPDIFEDASASLGSAPERIASCAAVGTDLFGLQGSAFTTPAGELPMDGVPAGELECDTNFAHTAIDVAPYYPINFGVGATAGASSAPSSSKPNSTLTVSLDATASTSSTDCTLNRNNAITPGQRLCRLTFYDRATLAESWVSDEFTVNVPEEDENNPTAQAVIKLTNLPVSLDRRPVSTRIYMTLADSGTLLLRRQVDTTDIYSVTIPIDDTLAASSDAIDLTNIGAPQRAKYVAESQSRLIVAGLPDQDDGIMYSQPFKPETFPVGNVFPVDTGDAAITGIKDLLGTIVVCKRNTMVFYLFDRDGLPTEVRTVQGDGVVSHNSIQSLGDRLYAVSDRGPIVILPGGDTYFIGSRISPYFRGEDTAVGTMDKRFLSYVHGGINRERNRYEFVVKDISVPWPDRRFAIEFEHPSSGNTEAQEMRGGHRFSFYQDPTLTALGDVQAEDGGPSRFVGGTHQGFMVWLERKDTRMGLSGALVTSAPGGSITSGEHWGDRQLTVGATELTGDIDFILEGPMGMKARWWTTTAEAERLILFGASTLNELYVLDPFEELYPNLTGLVQGDLVAIGSMLAKWCSKDFDASSPHKEKRWLWADLTRRISSGSAYLDLFTNLSSTAEGTWTLDLTVNGSHEEIGNCAQRARTVRLCVRTKSPDVDVDFEFFDVVLVAVLTDNA